jgi:hypothetical protein
MSTNVEAVPSLKSPALPPPHLRPASFDDYEQIERLESAYLPEYSTPDDWPVLWLGSPLWPRVGKSWPIGWVLETSAGEIVGSLGSIPLLYKFRGGELMAASGRGWVVTPAYRGFALWLLEERFNQPSVDLFMDTTIGPPAFESFSQFSNRIPAGDWETISYFITGYRAFATIALRKLKVPLVRVLAPPGAATLWLRDAIFSKALPKASGSFEIEATDRFDSRFDVFWDELLRQNTDTLLAARDGATLSWHFAVPMRTGRLWIFTASRKGRLQAYCIFKRQGYAQDVRMRLVDYQSIEPAVDLLPDLLGAALRRCIAEGVFVLDKPGLGIPKMRAFDEFAPYRQKQNWPLFYRAVDSALDAELRQPRFWDPSEYDGDASLE